MSHTATLLGMPPELFDNIANSTYSEDLGSLRLVSRECAMKVSSVYKIKHFRTRRVKLATETSIANAISIVHHPEFGAAVGELLLIDDAISDTYGWDGEEAEDPEKGAAILRKAEVHYDSQQQMMNCGLDRRLLTDLFRKCFKRGIRALEYSSWNEGCWTQKAAWRLYGASDNVAKDDHCFMTVMLAIISSGVGFETFKMNAGSGAGIHICTYGTDFQKGAICKAALSNFEALDLALCASEDDEGAGYQTALEFLTMMTRLRIRSLKVTAVRHSPPYQRIPLTALLQLDFPAMELLELGGVHLDLDDSLMYLKRQKSLRELTIDACVVSYSPRWTGIEKRGLSQGLESVRVIDRKSSFHEKLDGE